MKIGVFDSGMGARSFARAIKAALPELDVAVYEDRDNVPYGNKTSVRLLELVTPIFARMQAEGCQAIVVACNTVSTTIIQELRARCRVPLVATEPMIKPAAVLSRSGIIAVCATPATLNSKRYSYLKNAYAGQLQVLEPDCSDWASMIEHDQIDTDIIASRVSMVLDQGADVIVLGCTHYHWIEDEIRELCAGRATVMQPEQPVIAELTRVLAQLA